MQFHKLTADRFEFECGGAIDNFEIAYHTSPREYRKGDKVIWICHALTANSDPEDWWSELVGPGKLMDTDKYFVVCSNMPGSPYGTTSPVSINPATGKPYLLDYPAVTVRDIVSSIILVRKALGIEKVDLLMGSSIGGFYAIEWAVTEPDVIKRAVFIATTSRVSPYLTAFMEAQRMAIEADASFREAKSPEGGLEGMKCARAIALISYRCFEGYCLTQKEDNADVVFARKAASYERYQGEKLAKRFNAYSYWYIANCVDSNNVGRGRGGEAAALGTIKADTTLVSIDTDCIFTAYEMEKMVECIPGCKYHMIKSLFGHDGFLLETGQLTEILKPLIED